jgi:hypothetical protein
LSVRPFYLRTLSKKDKRTNNGVINIGGQHNNLNQKRPTDKQWGNQHWWTTQLPKVRKKNGQTME